ncbi:MULTISPECIES: hypothetical protein [unclassified Burkholderia]|uniref:hypothetical protein n=1 Tax=unclassified Burkholderia TaxID=2613784 RepID=UPI00075DA8AA|nr:MULTISPECIES: hypothetical protein [unclassified Burkholderia]KVN19061.1 hypothetical protein WT08_00770 [Burkholderia sp. MSMB1552]KWZ47025.1 hypothetical protein WS92_30290 [Burkholderia sp. MSMB1588]
MPDTCSALTAIRAELARAPVPLIDRPVALSQELSASTIGLSRYAAFGREDSAPASRTLYLDVPVRNIVGLFHRSFAPDARTWRELLAGLHGDGWGPETLRYFESELGDEHFPAPGAAYGLRLQGWGAALVCSNGMHRLVAGACWLATRQGDEATFRKVRVDHFPLREQAVAVMTEAQRRGESVEALHNRDCVTVAIRTRTTKRYRYWRLDGEAAAEIPAPGGWLDRLRRRTGWPTRVDKWHWQCVPPAVIDALGHDAWLREQLDNPRYPDAPLY